MHFGHFRSVDRFEPAKCWNVYKIVVCYDGLFPRGRAFRTIPLTRSVSSQIVSTVYREKFSVTPLLRNYLTVILTGSTLCDSSDRARSADCLRPRTRFARLTLQQPAEYSYFVLSSFVTILKTIATCYCNLRKSFIILFARKIYYLFVRKLTWRKPLHIVRRTK